MKRLFLFLLLSVTAVAQTFDAFGGGLTFTDSTSMPLGPGGPDVQSASCSQTTTTVTCNVTNGSAYANGVTISMPMDIQGTGTALDWNNATCVANPAQSQCGALKLTNVVGNVLTLTSPVSQSITSHTGTIRPQRWYVSITGGRVRLNSPLDHWFFDQEVVQAAATAIAKYGSNSCNTAKDEFPVWCSLGNGAGQGMCATGHSNSDNSYYDGGACPSNNRIPFHTEDFVSSYCSNNLAQGTFSGVAQPCKDMNYALDPNYVCQGISRASLDFLDPMWPLYTSGWIAGNITDPAFFQSGFYKGIDWQDSGVGGASPTNSGWTFNTAPSGKNDCHQGFVVFATAPIQTGSSNVLYSGSNAPYLFADPKVYMKTGCTFNPYGNSTTCTTPPSCPANTRASICGLSDWLLAKYGTIGALNTAWGGTSYTTFGTSGTIITAELIGTGNGVATSFSHTLANSHIDPVSIQIRVAGTPVGFDCPSAGASCPAAGAGKGTFTAKNGGTITGGVVTYATGAMTNLTFSSPPANGAQILGYYEINGWGQGGTGIMDEDGTHLGANGVCAYPPPAFQSSHAYNVDDLISDSISVSWQRVSTAGTSGSSTPSFSATVGNTTTSNGAVFTSEGAPVCGPGGTYTGSLPNAQMGADLDAFLLQVGAAYFSGTRSALQAVAPDVPNWCADQLGVWQTPPNVGILQAANLWCDVAMGDLWDPSLDGAGPIKFTNFTHYFSGPVTNYQFFVTTQSQWPCNGNVPCYSTQQQTGQGWYRLVNWFLNYVGYDGLKHAEGMEWGGNIDNSSGQGSSDGFETSLFNPYNGHDNVTGTVSCLYNAFTCGSETVNAGNNTDKITHAGCGNCIADATKLWLLDTSVASGFTFGQGVTINGGSIH